MKALYNNLSSHLRKSFGCKVFKVTVDGGFTCPNRDATKGLGGCVYCEPSTLTPKEYGGANIRRQLEVGIEKVRRRHRAEKFMAYFQVNTNTYAPLETLERMYREAFGFPEVAGIAVSTRPDCVDDRVLDLLKGFMDEGKRLWLELGLQSANDETLRAVNRGHTAAEFEDAVARAHRRGIDVCAHVIVGLPGEGRDEVLDTMRFLARLKVWGVKFHQLQVIKGTELQRMYEEGKVRVLSLDEYAGLVVESLEVLPHDTIIHRLCGDVPSRYLVAPNWGANKFIIMERITALMRERNTFQGARFVAQGMELPRVTL